MTERSDPTADTVDARKREEADFHDRLRSAKLRDDPREYEHLTENKRFYAIDRASRQFIENWLVARCAGKRVLDYCCGDGKYSFVVAEHQGRATGIDISPVSIDNSRKEAARRGLQDRTEFLVMDAENMSFADDSFSYACVAGVLHHLDLPKAYAELARVIEPGGAVVSLEALGHNPIINAYRRRTPHLRTTWEAQHIIKMKDLTLAKRYFRYVELRFFHLASIAAVPLRNTPLFRPALSVLEGLDAILLRIPIIREQAWMVGFVLRDPIKPAS